MSPPELGWGGSGLEEEEEGSGSLISACGQLHVGLTVKDHLAETAGDQVRGRFCSGCLEISENS